jgi:NADH-quinone oxidoreductase subunit L
MLNVSFWVLFFPLLGFIILGLLGRLLPRGGILTVAWGACGLSFLFAVINFISLLGTPANARVADTVIYHWVSSGNFSLDFALLYDPLTAVMLLVITGVGFLIHIYSAGYMADDPGFWRFFTYMNFFIFAMTLLVTADNFLFLLVGWGLVGLASFLLIGFWYQRPSAVAAARKAFVINVIGDFGLMLAIFLIFNHFGTLSYQGVFGQLNSSMAGSGLLTAICLLLFVACAAKSAQLPLYMWLPDAMEGPTPVSALIHAATMVTAGVYLVARANPLFYMAPIALYTVGAIGGITAIFAAVIAIFQLDIKRVLAYSTISQLGYMFMAEGVTNFAGGIFHLVTHAFFKALLFLGAGAVIHALAGEQDMRKMGGLWQRMPITAWTFLAATLAISGIIPFAGFWSKDSILASVLAQATISGNAWFYILWAVGVLTAGLTAFYMFRLFFGIFFGSYRGGPQASAEHEEEDEEDEVAAGHHERMPRYNQIFEVPAVMSVPLIILGVLSVIGGFIGSLALIGLPQWHPLPALLAPVVGQSSVSAIVEPSLGLEWISTGISLVLAAIGILLAWRMYGKGFEYKENRNPLYQFAFHKFYVDEALTAVLVNPIMAFGRAATRFLEGDTLDAGSRGIATTFRGVSAGLRRLQTGYVRNYALAILVGAVLIVIYYAVRR